MSGLILKDLLNMKKQLKIIAVILVIYGIAFIPKGNGEFISGVVIMLAVMINFNLFAFDEASKWDRYALTTPLSYKEIVLSRYCTSLLFLIASGILSFIAELITKNLNGEVNMKEMLLTIGIIMSIGLIIISITTPIIYKVGVEKSRILVMIIFIIPFIIIVGGEKLIKKLNITMPSEEVIKNIINIGQYIYPLVIILILLCSYFISTNIYRKKEF